MNDHNYVQEFDYVFTLPPDTRSWWRKRRDTASYWLWHKWAFWWTYRRGERLNAYRAWWSERP